jgi:hypothetical protein
MVTVGDKTDKSDGRDRTTQLDPKRFEATLENVCVHIRGWYRCHKARLKAPEAPDVSEIDDKAAKRALNNFKAEKLEYD